MRNALNAIGLENESTNQDKTKGCMHYCRHQSTTSSSHPGNSCPWVDAHDGNLLWAHQLVMDRKLITAPNMPWFYKWLYLQENQDPEEWTFIKRIEQLYRYRNVTLYVLASVHPDISKIPDYRRQLEAHRITLEFIDG